MWARAWDWVVGLLPEEVWWLVGIGLLILAALTPIALIADRQRTDDAEAAAGERVEAFAAALADGEGETACEMLGDEATAELVRRIGRVAVPTSAAGSCEEAVRVAAARRPARQTRALRHAKVLEVDYDEEWTAPIREDPGRFEEATAIVRLRNGKVELKSESVQTNHAGSWTIQSAAPILDLIAP